GPTAGEVPPGFEPGNDGFAVRCLTSLATAPRCGLFVVDLAAKINGRRAARRFCEAALLHRVFACAKSYATIYGMFDDAQHDGAHLYVTTGSVLYGGGSVVRMKGERRSTP